MGCIFSKKINNLDFCHFLRPPPSGGDFWPIWPPFPHPMGHPTQLPTWLPTFMFFVSNESKNNAWSWKFNHFCLFSKRWVVNRFWPFLAVRDHLSVWRAVRGWLKNAQRRFPLVIHMVTRAQTSVEHVQSILCNSWTRHCPVAKADLSLHSLSLHRPRQTSDWSSPFYKED